MEDRFQVGVISSTHGLKGEVKVYPTTDDVTRFNNLKEVDLDTGKEMIRLQIQNVRFFKQFAIIKFKGYNDINEIEKYKGKSLYVDRENAVPLDEDEYYIADLIDMKVKLEDESEFGVLKDVMQTGANDVYVIEMTDGREVLVPAIADCIKKVDIQNAVMTIHLLDGLM